MILYQRVMNILVWICVASLHPATSIKMRDRITNITLTITSLTGEVFCLSSSNLIMALFSLFLWLIWLLRWKWFRHFSGWAVFKIPRGEINSAYYWGKSLTPCSFDCDTTSGSFVTFTLIILIFMCKTFFFFVLFEWRFIQHSVGSSQVQTCPVMKFSNGKWCPFIRIAALTVYNARHPHNVTLLLSISHSIHATRAVTSFQLLSAEPRKEKKKHTAHAHLFLR